jgi:small-conductance mechanosensitive channel
MSDNTIEAIVTAAVWLAVVLALRWALRRAVGRWSRRLAERDAAAAARQRTAFSVVERVVLAVVVLIALWSVLATFPTTAELGRALLASGAVIAVFAGVALSTPLGNIGSGLIVAFTQPVRLGDRVSIAEATGFVEEISLIYTVLVTDDNRHVYVPNTQLTSSVIVNRTVNDPRRTVTASLPVDIAAPVEEARNAVLDALARIPAAEELELRVAIGDVGEKVVWLNVTALAPPGTDVGVLSSEVRERALGALRGAELLPA